MSKKEEVMLAVWPNANPSPYWNHDPLDSQSMWLSFRNVETETREDGSKKVSLNSYNEGVWCINVGLYVWAWTDMSSAIDLKAHEVHSANARELQNLATWLKKRTAKIEKMGVPKSFGLQEQIILTLQAMGIKKAIMIDTSAQNWAGEYTIMSIEDALALPNYSKTINDMQALRERSSKRSEEAA